MMKNLVLSFALVAVSPFSAVSMPNPVKRAVAKVASIGKKGSDMVKSGAKATWKNKAKIAKVAAITVASVAAAYLLNKGAARGLNRLGTIRGHDVKGCDLVSPLRGLASVVSPRLTRACQYVANNRLVTYLSSKLPGSLNFGFTFPELPAA